MKKGFTLIEILTVILLIGIISTVVTVNYTRYLKAAKLSAFKDSMTSLIEQLENYQINHPGNYTDAQTINFKEIELENEKTISGKFKVEDNYIVLVNVTDKIYCANGNKNNLNITEQGCN